MDKTLSLRELEHLYAWLLPKQRDELLQCLPIAASREEEAMTEVLGLTILCHAAEELPDEMGEGQSLAGER